MGIQTILIIFGNLSLDVCESTEKSFFFFSSSNNEIYPKNKNTQMSCWKNHFIKWIYFNFQDSGSGVPVTMRVDPKGFYLCWVDQNNEMDLLDVATIRDVRTGQYAKKPRVSFSFLSFYYYYTSYNFRIFLFLWFLLEKLKWNLIRLQR